MRDWHLVTIVFIFIFLDLLILISVTAITGSRYTVITIPDKENPGEHTNVYVCQTKCHCSSQMNASPIRMMAIQWRTLWNDVTPVLSTIGYQYFLLTNSSCKQLEFSLQLGSGKWRSRGWMTLGRYLLSCTSQQSSQWLFSWSLLSLGTTST